jgi:hypothetical protein
MSNFTSPPAKPGVYPGLIIAEERDLAPRTTLIDKDISEIVQDIGLQTTKRVLENTRDEIALKKKKRD